MTGRRPLLLSVVFGVLTVPDADPAHAQTAPAGTKRPVEAADVAKFPAPGTVVPAAFAYSPDGKSLTYLKAESASPGRVLWKLDVGGETPRVVARPPGSGDTDANVSQVEALRRERMRLRESGITQAVHAVKADVAVVPLQGDLYLLRGESPLERLTETPSPEIDPKPNADGTKVAFVRDDELYVLDLATKAETKLTRGAGGGVTHGLAEFVAQEEMARFSGFWWSPDGRHLAYQETDEHHIPPYSIVHQAGEAWTVETHRYPFSGEANAKVRLGVIPVTGGETTWLALSDSNEEVYLARVDWESPDSLLVQVLPRDQKSLKLYRYPKGGGEPTLLVGENSDTWVNLHQDLRALKGTGEIVWSSERTGFRHLELRDRDGKLLRVLTAGDWAVDELLAVDEARREVWFSAGKDSPLELHVYRVSLDGGPVERATRERGNHKAVVAKDGDTFADVYSSRQHPPVTTLRDRDGKALATIDDAGADPRLAELRIVPPVLTEYKNRDGATLHGAYYAPRGKANVGRVPLVVMVYGGPHVQTVTNSWAVTADMTAQFLAEQGFAVWKTDNRGSSRRGHAFEAAVNRNMGTLEVQDQVDGVRFVAASWPDVDTNRVGVTGGSYGGYMTLRCLTLAPETFKAGVSVAPVTDWDGYDTCYTERYMGTPRDNAKGYEAASVLPRAGDLAGDLLLVHGLLDENVHYRHTARLTDALVLAGKPFEVLPLPDSRHGIRRESDKKYVTERTARFFRAKLAAEPR